MKVGSQNSNKNMIKQMAENGQKVSGNEEAIGMTSLVPGVKNSSLWNCLELDWAYPVYYGRSPTK